MVITQSHASVHETTRICRENAASLSLFVYADPIFLPDSRGKCSVQSG